MFTSNPFAGLAVFLPPFVMQAYIVLMVLMDEYVGGYSTFYVTNERLLNRGLELLGILKEDI